MHTVATTIATAICFAVSATDVAADALTLYLFGDRWSDESTVLPMGSTLCLRFLSLHSTEFDRRMRFEFASVAIGVEEHQSAAEDKKSSSRIEEKHRNSFFSTHIFTSSSLIHLLRRSSIQTSALATDWTVGAINQPTDETFISQIPNELINAFFSLLFPRWQ